MVLRPKNLAHRRWWSRKYPICIIFPAKGDHGRRSSSPLNATNILQGMFDEKVASDAPVDADTSKQEQTSEVGVDALLDDTRATEAEDADDELGKDILIWIEACVCAETFLEETSN